MTSISPICLWCKHYRQTTGTTCDAFPDRIPEDIIRGRNMHRTPFPGDHGIQFEEGEDGPPPENYK